MTAIQTCSPQRYLANNRNAFRSANLTPSSVSPGDAVLSIPVARKGTAQVALSGNYTGDEQAQYDVQILDDDVDTNLLSSPIFTGAGTGSLGNITASSTPQSYTVQLADSGTPTSPAFVDFEGVKIVARASGDIGNAIHILIDQSPMTFTPSFFSLLDDLPVGSGSDSQGLQGAAFDWNTAVIGSDNQIPSTAKRIAFGDDRGLIYLQYKRWTGTEWLYSFVPEIKRDVPKGTIVNFVTGGRDVTVTAGGSPPDEVFHDVETVFDFLEALALGSKLVTIEGVIANDRSPTGQAARDISLRTDAHADPSYGSGGAATALADAFVNAGAGTELVVATCYAVTGHDDPGAHLGAELWKVKGSLAGDVGIATTGVPFVAPGSPPAWGFTIPQRLPDGYGQPHGSFTVVSENFPRSADEEPPKVCMVALELGPDAVDQQVTLTWTARPSGDCLCDKMTVPNLRTPCLGIFDDEGGADMAYSDEAITRLKALYDWGATLADAVTNYVAGFDFRGFPVTQAGFSTFSASWQSSTKGISGSGSNALSTTVGGGADMPADLTSVQTGFADCAIPADFQDVLDFYENGIAQIDAVLDGTLKAAGFAQWDLALAAFQDDFGGTTLEGLGNRLGTIATEKYNILVRQAMAYAGIPQVGKANADSVLSGDGCWRDWGDGFYWEVVGSDGGKYAPAFNNHPYYSSRKATDGSAYYSTHEFAFQPNVKCPELLKEGDEIILSIGGAGFSSTYQVGDTLTLPVIAAQPLYLVGGQDGDDTQKWYVSGSVDGPLPPFSYSASSGEPHSYSSGSPGGLSFDITDGGIPFVKGDKFAFGVEGGHYQWRLNGGSWSSPLPIPLAPTALDAGLTITFTTGASPSFVAGDIFSFLALQPWAVSNMQSPTPERWQWVGDTPSVVADLGSVQALDMAAIALHTLPEGSVITLEGGTSPGVYDWTEAMTWQPGVIFKVLDLPRNSRYVRLSLSGVTDAGIGWFWIGQGLSTELSAAIQISRSYKILRETAGLRSVGKYVGRTLNGAIEWTDNVLNEDDAANIAQLLDWVKSNDDEGLIVVPQITRPSEAIIAQITSDEIDIVDVSDYNRDAAYPRRFAVTLPLAGIW